MLLQWWKETGKDKMTNSRNNKEKSLVWKAAVLDNGWIGRYSRDCVKNRFHYIRTAFKAALKHNATSGNSPAQFQYMELCEFAFADDYDINPPLLVETGSTPQQAQKRRRTRSSSAKGGMTEYQIEKLKLKKEEQEEKRKFRSDILQAIQVLTNK